MADVVVYVRKNAMEVVNATDHKTAVGSAPFTSTRLLVGNFPEAESLLRRLVKEVTAKGLFATKPRMVIQPLEMTEGGLSMVEERVFLELGEGAGARAVKIHLGEKLPVQAALALLDAEK